MPIMRKDVKLGFAIGGVLLAVLIVYVLVVPGGKDERLTSAAGGSDANAQKANGGGGAGVTLEPIVPPSVSPTTQPLPGSNTASAAGGTPPPAPPATFNPPAGGASTDPFEQQPADPPVSANARSKDVDWSKLLNDSDVLMVTPAAKKPTEIAAVLPVSTAEKKTADAVADITKPGPTPVVPPTAMEDKPAAPPAAPTPVPAPITPAEPIVPQSPPVAENPTTTEPMVGPQQPPAGIAPTHTVETGETFSTIALRYYGDANLYGPLMRANPGIEPTKLRPGMKVTIPPAGEVRPAIAKAAPVHGAPVNSDQAQVSSSKVEIDPATQYRVQGGDSLYSIGKKLYGRGDKADALYQANKAQIGEDMHRLKLGQVLTLPEPPTKK
jgi:nucleoid-associated protein YgaU